MSDQRPKSGPAGVERADAVVVGARCAGSAVAATLARAGRRVVVLDRMRFPSDQLSTHVLVSSAVAETARIGALERLLALNPAKCHWVSLHAGGADVHERWTAVDAIDYALCIPRPEQDQALVDTARAFDADVRERCDVEEIVWDAGRAVGVRYRHGDSEHEIRAPLVVGADGRRSTVAALVGAARPYRASRNVRGCVFRYMDDPQVGTRWHQTMSQWRAGPTLGYSFPSINGRLVVLLMPPAEEVAEFRRDPDRMWAAKLDEHAGGLRERLDGVTNVSKIRSTPDTTSYFRVSSGPGWALAGDAGHFKDPLIGQGQRDAIRHGRLLAEAVVEVLDDPARLDLTLRRWEHQRDRDCFSSYHWGNRESRALTVTPLIEEVARTFVERPGRAAAGDSFGRVLPPEDVIGPRRVARAALTAWRRPGVDRRALLAELVRELPIERDIRLERLSSRFRYARRAGSENPDPHPPPVPKEPKRTRAAASDDGDGAGPRERKPTPALEEVNA